MKLAYNSEYHYIAEDGTLTNERTGGVIKHQRMPNGRLIAHIMEYGFVRTAISIARAVAVAYVPNPDNMRHVRHKDNDRSNVNASNLYWSNHRAGGVRKSAGVTAVKCSVFDNTSGVETTYASIQRASEALAIAPPVLAANALSSTEYPLLRRYVITIDKDELFNNAVAGHIGSNRYVYDVITGETTECPSRMVLSYVIGSSTIPIPESGVAYVRGYVIANSSSVLAEAIPRYANRLHRDILKSRDVNARTALRRRYSGRAVYDYATKEMSIYSDYDGVCMHIRDCTGIDVPKGEIVNAVSRSADAKRVAMIAGMGVAGVPVDTTAEDIVWGWPASGTIARSLSRYRLKYK